MLNINTCTRLFITGICRTGQIAHIFRRILLITFFEFLNFYRTTDFTMQNVVTSSSTISSIPRYETGQGFIWFGKISESDKYLIIRYLLRKGVESGRYKKWAVICKDRPGRIFHPFIFYFPRSVTVPV